MCIFDYFCEVVFAMSLVGFFCALTQFPHVSVGLPWCLNFVKEIVSICVAPNIFWQVVQVYN